MKTIYDVDKNFSIESNLDIPGIKYYNALSQPFSLHGVFYDEGKFRRLPEQVAKDTNDGVHWLHDNTAGGRVRFRTDSAYIAIHTDMPQACFMSHCALTGSACFDLYVRDENGKERFVESFKRTVEEKFGYEAILRPEGSGMREYTINFPTYSAVNTLFIGLEEGAAVEAPAPYAIEKPVVFYGSSITQGGCSSRPGTAYESIVCRRFDCDYVNLGFSGSARGEQVMADYIAGLDMSVFVLDYDHNSPTVEHLAATHEKFFQTIRKAHPQLPIIMMARPLYNPGPDAQARFAVIQKTYENAKNAGDENVYLLDGPTLMALAGDDGRVDGAHPNDLGFGSMAKAVGDVLEIIYG